MLLLVEKSRLHALVRLLDDRGFRAGARFAVLALVVLPLLPEGPFGPMGGIRPRALWALVLFFSGLSFCGYIARTIVGDRYGYAVAGLLGGLVSSTSVTLTYARLSREPGVEGTRWPAGPGSLFRAVRASGGRRRGPQRDAPATPNPAARGAIGHRSRRCLVEVRGGASGGAPPQAPSNPLQLVPALQMAAAFQLVLFLLEGVNRRFGNAGLLASASR